MTALAIYNGGPTSAAADGTLVSGANPVAFAGLVAGSNGETSPVKLAVRTTQSGKYAKAGATITPTGTNASKVALAPDSGGSPGTWGAYGAALTLGAVADTNTIIWAKAKNTSGESAGTDTTVTLVVSPDAWNTPPAFASGPQPTAINDTSAVIAWSATDADGDSVTAKVIVKTSSTAPSDSDWSGESNQSSPFTKSGLTVGTTYYYWVRLHDGTEPTVSARGSFVTSLIATGSSRLLDVRASISAGSTPRADGTTTSPWKDYSGNAHDGTLFGGPVWKGVGSGGDPYCLLLDGTDDYVDFGNLAAWDICGSGKSWSIEAWFKTSDGASTNRGIFDRFVSVTGGFALAVSTAQKARITNVVSGANSSLSSTASVNDGNWHHVVVTYDDATKVRKIYVDNGTPDTDTLAASPANDSSENLLMSGDGASTQKFPGRIAQARIYNRALTSTEVGNHYTAGVTA